MKVSEIERPIQAVIKIGDGVQHPNNLFQVVLDPAKLSPSKDLIALDGTESQLHGWRRIEHIEIVEVLDENYQGPAA